MVPVSAPAPSGGAAVDDYPVPQDLGACPGPYIPGVPQPGDRVAVNGIVYQCRTTVEGRHCAQAGYEPGVAHSHDIGTTELWQFVWDVLGICSGSAPAPVPAPWTAGVPYTTGSTVTHVSGSTAVVYTCGAYPVSGHCDDASYQPGTSYASIAWTATATCT